MHALRLDQNFNACLRTDMQRKFRQLLAMASQVEVLFCSRAGVEINLNFLVDSVPGVDLPVLLKLFGAVEVRSALPLVIVGAVLIAAIEYHYQSFQVPVLLIRFNKIIVRMNVVIIPRMSIIGRLSLAKLFYFQTLIWPLNTGIL